MRLLSLKVLATFVKKEFRQILRTKEMRVLLFGVPLIQLLVMGFAVTNEVKHVKLVIEDRDKTTLSQKLSKSFANTDRFDLINNIVSQSNPAATYRKPLELISDWKAQIAIIIPPGFARDITLNQKPAVQIISDGLDGNTAAVAVNYANGIIAQFIQTRILNEGKLWIPAFAGMTGTGNAATTGMTGTGNAASASTGMTETGTAASTGMAGTGNAASTGMMGNATATSEGMAGSVSATSEGMAGSVSATTGGMTGAQTMVQIPAQINVQDRMWYNQDLDSAQYMIPGIIAILLTVTSMMLSAMSLVKEKEIGTLEQLMVTPATKTELLLGKLIPYWIISMFEIALVTFMGHIIFGIHFSGSVLSLGAMAAVFLLTTLGLGIFVSANTQTQQQAMFFTWFIMVFMILLSGLFIPIQNMPLSIRRLTLLNPMSYFMTITREIVIKGNGLTYLWKECLALVVYGVGIFAIAVSKFHKRT